ncbi:restriction endonuclease subunit S, partial [Azotobacter chroococcum]|nr:restriction endonuclease subunit S [Azotobacter chroococcum]
MSHYKAYPAYKDSGVEWLGRVPEHWDILPLKSVVTFRSGGTPSKDNLDFWDGDIPWASAKDLKKEQLEDTQDHLTELAVTSGAASLVAAGSVLVVVRGMILARTFPVVEAMVPMAINQDLKALQALQALDEKFLAYLLRGLANESLRRLEEAGHGTKALRMELWTSMQLTIPPKEEQQSISTYLARETARIDALVAKKTRFIELLREKRQALITHAVTKGLDPNVKMKDSGMEWLGEVPEHWGVGVVSRVATRTVVGIAEAATHAYADSGTPILRSTNIRPYKIGGEILYVNADFADDRDTKLIHADDLVTVRTGNAGVTAVVPPELDGCQCFTMLITTLKD